MNIPTSSRPLVSVCIPTYNRAQMLRECIGSILQQSMSDFELIVCDNNSEDMTEAVVKSFNDKRLKYFKNSHNIGIRGNWNRCLSLASGVFITIFPDDDMMMPNNLENKVAVLSENPAIGLVHSKYHVMNAEGQIIKYDTNWKHSSDRFIDEIEDRESFLTSPYNTINAPTVLFRKECYTRLGEFSSKLSFAIDWEYWMRISIYFDVAYLALPLVKWRVHSGTLTAMNLDSDQVFKLCEDMMAKKVVIKSHLRRQKSGWNTEWKIWQQMAIRFADEMDMIIHRNGRNSVTRSIVIKLCAKFPELLYSPRTLKILLKVFLHRRVIILIKYLLNKRVDSYN